MSENQPLISSFTTTRRQRLLEHSREALAELLGTAVLVIFGTGTIAATVISKGANGGWLNINLGFGIGLIAGIYVAAGISGAHLNPAVTLTLAVYRKFPWSKVALYMASQFAGAFLGAAVVYSAYYPSLSATAGFGDSTRGIFATYPQADAGIIGAFFNEFIGTFMLLFVILATGDTHNHPAGPQTPLILGMTLAGIGASLGYETGFALNPARDFGPRLFTAIAGWGFGVFTADDFYTWIPLVAPLVGGLAAGLTYDRLLLKRN